MGWVEGVAFMAPSERLKRSVASPAQPGVVSLSHPSGLLCVLHLGAWKRDWDTIGILGSR